MKKASPYILLFLFVMFVWHLDSSRDFGIEWDGDQIDGPFGMLVGALFAGGGVLIAAVVLVCVATLLALVFAGVGVMLIGALALGAVLLAAALSPLLLPLLIPAGIIWLLVRRNRTGSTLHR